MSDVAIKVENLSKLYQLGEVGTGTISHDLNRWWAKIQGKEDPYTKIGQTNDRTKKAESDFVWALKDINFEVEKGEVLGIIGRNGAGKSTLLKILSKITSPTTGKIYNKGRIASLLEVGTGFHPEMTGRENIYLNGAILGMRKWEIDKKFDEIVDFAGVESYVDTPVKRYSSGMYVRLAFAVAAYLEPEILIVDEVLAVGDAEFQKKCLGRMKDVSVNDGRTVLFVSHNMAAVSKLCVKSILLQNGHCISKGLTSNIIQEYANFYDFSSSFINKSNNGILRSLKIDLTLDKTLLKCFFKFNIPEKLNDSENLSLEVIILNSLKEKIAFFGPSVLGIENLNLFNLKIARLDIDISSLINGQYTLQVQIVEPGKKVIENYEEVVGFEISNKIFGSNTFIVHQNHQVGSFILNKYHIEYD